MSVCVFRFAAPFVSVRFATLKSCVMKLSDFISLSVEEKKQVVLSEGVLIAKRTEPGSFIFLFRVFDFYVEAYFNPDEKNIKEFRMFYRSMLLQSYLDSISTDDLLN